MLFTSTEIEGPRIVELQPIEDERGFFARAWCSEEFAAEGLTDNLVQANLSFSRQRGTLRGMHLQIAPNLESKLVRCVAGSIQDVIVDLRPESSSFQNWITVELTADNHRALYVPEGFAQGFLTLAENTKVLYQVSATYAPESEVGLRFDDPAFNIEWQFDPLVVSTKDSAWPDFNPVAYISLVGAR